MIVLGIDPGFTTTGFSIIAKIKESDVIIDYGYLSLSAKKDLNERIRIFYDFFKAKIIKYNIMAISLETPFLGKNIQTFLKLGYLRGTLYLLSAQYQLELYEFSPRQVKQQITGFGGAEKDQVARMISMIFPTIAPQKKNDVTDAIAIGLCGLWDTKN